MVSPFQNKERGFGLPLSEDELAAVNEFRQREGRTALEATLGTRFLLPGKNREGYWGFAEFDEQVIDVMDCIEVLEPNRQIAIEVDHSARHAKYLYEGLHMANMNAKYGGKQKALRDSVMTEECLSPGNATMYLNVTMYLNGGVQISSPSSQQKSWTVSPRSAWCRDCRSPKTPLRPSTIGKLQRRTRRCRRQRGRLM